MSSSINYNFCILLNVCGIYKCFDLFVFCFLLVPPEIVTAPADEKVVEGNSLNLSCNATGNPQPDITWTKERERSVQSTSETLELRNLSSKDNGQVYICKVNNSLGFDEANATITVLCEYIVCSGYAFVSL